VSSCDVGLRALFLGHAGQLGTGRNALQEQAGVGYEWRPSEDPTFFPGRQASVLAQGKTVGYFGVVHPEVLAAFDIPYPVSALEINVEPFVFDQFFKPLPTHMQTAVASQR
jgi:phenylalanyl-tRNA synthetase beta subunit